MIPPAESCGTRSRPAGEGGVNGSRSSGRFGFGAHAQAPLIPECAGPQQHAESRISHPPPVGEHEPVAPIPTPCRHCVSNISKIRMGARTVTELSITQPLGFSRMTRRDPPGRPCSYIVWTAAAFTRDFGAPGSRDAPPFDARDVIPGNSRLLAHPFLLSAGAWIHLPDWLSYRPQPMAAVAGGERDSASLRLYLKRTRFRRSPGLFWVSCSDRFAVGLISLGLGLAVLAMTGISDSHGMALSVAVWFSLWMIYLSLVNAGQIFYGFGWETLLLESGFLAIFLGSSDTRPPAIVIWLLLWVLFRIMFGAGMIKIRADPCWRDLTCMYYHYETQPLPNPLSWFFHHLPKPLHRLEVLFTHFVELIVPFFIFFPAPVCYVAGGLMIVFQFGLILSGNLSWLNYITIVLCIPCFDDALLSRLLPIDHSIPASSSIAHQAAVGALAVLVAVLSWRPVRNLFSRRQLMNASFEPLHLVNTYGAFGGVTRQRLEVVIEGTDSLTFDAAAPWREYEFKGKPGSVTRRPCLVSPYHYKLDWQMWFAAMSTYREHAWFVNVVAKLLAGDRRVLALLAQNPFPDKPPKFIRARWYRYRFTGFGEAKWWKRTLVGEYFDPVSLDDPAFRDLLRRQGWLDGD